MLIFKFIIQRDFLLLYKYCQEITVIVLSFIITLFYFDLILGMCLSLKFWLYKVPQHEIQQRAQQLKIPYVECSAMLGRNVENAFYELVRQVRYAYSKLLVFFLILILIFDIIQTLSLFKNIKFESFQKLKFDLSCAFFP